MSGMSAIEVVVLCPCLQIEIALARRIGYKLGEGGDV